MTNTKKTTEQPRTISRVEQSATERMAELVEFVQLEYQVPEHVVRAVCAVLVPCHPHRPAWLIIESGRHPFWDHLDVVLKQRGLPESVDLSFIRTNWTFKYVDVSRLVSELLLGRDKAPRIFLDYEAGTRHSMRGITIGHPYWLIVQECVHLFAPLEFKGLPSVGAKEELERLLKLAINDNSRLLPNTVDLSKKVVKVMELMARINTEARMTHGIWAGLALMPSAHAVLSGREELIEEDWGILRWFTGGYVKLWHRRVFEWWWDNVLQQKDEERAKFLPGPTRIKEIFGEKGLYTVKRDVNWIFRQLWRAGLMAQRRFFRLEKGGIHGGKVRRPFYVWDLLPEGELLCRMLFDKGLRVGYDKDLTHMLKPKWQYGKLYKIDKVGLSRKDIIEANDGDDFDTHPQMKVEKDSPFID